MVDRIPCVNPRCRRTAAADKFPGYSEIICGKCFRALPASTRRRHKTYWRRVSNLRRLYRRKDMQSRSLQIERMGDRNDRIGQRVWREIHDFFTPFEQPEGLDAFLEEMGLR